LQPPVIITPRLEPGVKVGDGFVSVSRAGGKGGRTVFAYHIDTPHFEHEGDDLSSPRDDLQEALATLLTFLSAAAEAYDYERRTGRQSDNSDLFPAEVAEWAHMHSDEIGMLAHEMEELDGLIEE
jgi:hypothetical protein